MTKLILLCLALVASNVATSQTTSPESHINANVPPAQSFDQYLRRDLLAYFKRSLVPEATAVEYQLLRKEPTQSGVAYPKYYAWVKVRSGTEVKQEGAVRLAAVEQRAFDVTNFLSKQQIQQRPSEVGTVFPAALIPAIAENAGAK